MQTFHRLLGNSLIAVVTNNFLWFALVYWSYLETHSVLVSSVIGGVFLVFTAASGFWFGSIVDHHKKKGAMLLSSAVTLLFFIASLALYMAAPNGAFSDTSQPWLWGLILLVMCGVTAGNIRNIALPTAVTVLIPEGSRDKANGLVGTMLGISFSLTSVASGLVLGYLGMFWVIVSGIALTIVALGHLAFLRIEEQGIVHTDGRSKGMDIRGTVGVIRTVPGLFALIFFTTFNNFLGGVFISLMDPYGLTLVSVQVWGVLWGFLSLGFIAGGAYIARRGLGPSPLKTLFRVNIILWFVCIFMAIQPWIALLAASVFIWVSLVPFVEATEHTIIQKVVPLERQGRVFGFAQSIEQAASPITSFLIGPIAQFFFIPFMTTGAGVDLIGGWFGVGEGRGMALVFILSGLVGLCVTLVAMRSRAYRRLDGHYQSAPPA